tara:strand:+ start:9284 stop:11125 length:1842 start_codon:yes stop_codon:yes gene_type:complete
MSIIEKLTEGIVNRDMAQEGAALLNKWSSTGLLEGLQSDNHKNNMARLLENQAKELLREASSMAGGDVEGFAAVAFPIVRRVFGGLIANDLVSVQPMSLPSGLIFFMDFTYSNARLDYFAGDSLYGGGKVGSQITGGVDLSHGVRDADPENGDNADKGFYNLNNGYSSPTGSVVIASGAVTAAAAITAETPYYNVTADLAAATAISSLTEAQKKQIEFDPDLLAATSTSKIYQITVTLTDAVWASINKENAIAVNINLDTETGGQTLANNTRPVRRLTRFVMSTDGAKYMLFTMHGDSSATAANSTGEDLQIYFPLMDDLTSGGALGSVVGQAEWGLEGAGNDNAGFDGSISKDVIPEIDIKVDSVAITAVTKKLKAKWTPELGQDLNAYHNLDAEVELTSILSEQIALEIDREILNDLVEGATAAVYYWARSPGLFVIRNTGVEIGQNSAAPDFTGTVSEWYETLIETINDVSAQIHRKTLRGGANFVVCSPEVANILEFTAGFRANVTADADKGEIGAVKVGSLSRKFDVMVDPYFPRNVLLVGRKGGSFLESGYVYAPYVPLQTTPTIFGPEDFVPRKGVMTRYGKKMVRPDMYGLVIVRGLLGEAGATS